MASTGMVRSERRGALTLLTLDRPERRNALDTPACEDLRVAVETAGTDGTRVFVLTGAGGHFCAGADLGGVREEGFRGALSALLDAMATSPLPLLAAVEGAALGAGTQLAVACDLRVAAATARFGVPAARLGLVVDHWTVRRLALLAGAGTARAMLLAAEEVTGADALRLGLVQREGALEDALARAGTIAELAPLSIAGHKLALNRTEGATTEDEEVTAARVRAWASADVEEGLAAFRERRPARFEGR